MPKLHTSRFLLQCAAALKTAPARADRVGDCRVGAYRLANGEVLDIAPSNGDTLRWRNFDGASGALRESPTGAWTGTSGWTERPDGSAARFDCEAGSIEFGGEAGKRSALDVT